MTEAFWSPVRLSIEVGLWCAALGFPGAAALGWVLARRDFPGKALVSTLLLLPLVLPPVVTGFLLLRVVGVNGLGLPLPFTFAGAVLASLVVSFPLYVVAARTAFEAADPRLEEVSATLGQSPARTAWRVTLPLALPGLAAGAVLAFARGLGEFGATIVVAGNMAERTRTIPLAVYSLLDAPGGEAAAAPLLWASVAISFLALGGYELLRRHQRRRLELADA